MTARPAGDADGASGQPSEGPYAALAARFRRMSLVREAVGVLQWDLAAVMPVGGAGVRGEQMAALREIAHQMLADAAVGELLEGAAEEAERGELDAWQLANLREMRRERLYATAVPADLVGRHSRAVSACEVAWRDHRAANDFAGLVPQLRVVLAHP